MTKDDCVKLTDKNFKAEVLESKIPVFVDFWGSWCPPCKMIAPIIDELAEQFLGIMKVGKLNVDQNPGMRSAFGVSAAPTFIIFNEGKVAKRASGAHSRKQLIRMIESTLLSRKSKSKAITVVGIEEPIGPAGVLEKI